MLTYKLSFFSPKKLPYKAERMGVSKTTPVLSLISNLFLKFFQFDGRPQTASIVGQPLPPIFVIWHSVQLRPQLGKQTYGNFNLYFLVGHNLAFFFPFFLK